MATVNKDFKIKSGLIVEGTTATVNGNDILTKNAGDQYIIDLIGGQTLITSVEATQLEVSNGELSVKPNVFDEYGAAATAESNAQTYTNNAVFNLASESYVNTAVNNAIDGFNSDLLNYTPTADLDTTIDGYGYLKSGDLTGYATETYVDQAETDANIYTDNAISGLSGSGTAVVAGNLDILTGTGIQVNGGNNSVEIDRQTVDTWYDAAGSASSAQQAAELYADNAIAALVDAAPATLDTLNELAAALQDNPDIITDLQDIAAGKQDTLTAGDNINITGSTISVTGLDTADVIENSVTGGLYFTNQRALDATASAYDASGAASTVQGNLDDHASDTSTHGVTGAIVGTTDTQTLTNKTISGSSNTLTNIGNSSLVNSAITVNGYSTDLGSSVTLSTDDVQEGNNKYYTDAQVRDVLTTSIQTNISITEVGNDLVITAENGVADSDTDDLTEGTTNLYFTNQRVYDAIDGQTITPQAVQINNYRKEEATQQSVASASTVNVHSFGYPYESVKYLVRVVGWDGGVKHSQITEILVTVDGNNNIAMTEYGNVHTSTNPLATFSATVVSAVPTLTATTAVSGCEIIAAATMLSWAD